MIFAHVLEPTWKTLPSPYDRLRPFYLFERMRTVFADEARA